MASAFVLLLGAIGVAPLVAMLGSPLVESLVFVLLAVVVGLVAVAMPAPEAARFRRSLQPALAIAAVPAVLLYLQIVPLPFLTHPIWMSAAEALGRSFLASVSLDIGATSLVLARYVGIVALLMASAACAVDRRRARALLIALTVAAVVSAMLGALAFSPAIGSFAAFDPSERFDMIDGACFGLVLAAACFYLAIERQKHPPRGGGRSPWSMYVRLLLCLAAFVTCLHTVLRFASPALLCVAALQGGVFGAVVLARRLEAPGWGVGIVAATFLLVAGALLLKGSDGAVGEPALTFADAPRFAVATAQRILADGSWTGNGAGSFPALVALYRQVDDPVAVVTLPTTAAGVAIGMGRPMVWAGLATALWLLATFVRGALRRGRDSVFAAVAAAAAACTAGFALAGFVNAGTFGLGSAIIAAGLCGLGLVQAEGRANTPISTQDGRAVAADGYWETTRRPFFDPLFEIVGEPRVTPAKGVKAARASLAAMAVVAGLFACWRLATEVAQRTGNTGSAAAIGIVRGDLWAAVAQARAATGDRASIGGAREAAATALAEAPLDAATWLLLADLAWRDDAGFKVGPLLEMAYLSASSDLALAPARLRLAARADLVGDDTLRNFVRRDVTSILRYAPDLKAAIVDAYRMASPAARALLEQAVTEVDPRFVLPR